MVGGRELFLVGFYCLAQISGEWGWDGEISQISVTSVSYDIIRNNYSARFQVRLVC